MSNRSNAWVYTRVVAIVSLSCALIVACSVAMVRPGEPTAARVKLTQLQADARLSGRAPVAMKDAELAVASTEVPQHDADLAAHLAYVADRKVDTARALAETRYAEDQRLALRQQRNDVRLAARTREADAAVDQAAAANAAVAVANAAAASAADQSAELLRQIDELQAKVTDRGLVLTLGDVLFTSGRSELRSAANGNLDKLVVFLGRYPDRSLAIEGHTDSVGTTEYNQDLSLRRANSVASYLTAQGVGATRISTLGKGETDPLAGNDSALGRQQNRRVEVIVNTTAVAQR
jgi:outer membrane protein OmpA-like peptidoglycan-associated protein